METEVVGVMSQLFTMGLITNSSEDAHIGEC